MTVMIDLSAQRLTHRSEQGLVSRYDVSTARNGAGQQRNSGCTPLGLHYIRAKIGADLPAGTVFRARRPTGEIYTAQLGEACPGRDWILTRILWLCGREIGFNRLGAVDTFSRLIYIHATPDSEPMGVPLSHGCIRMRNEDIIDLFDRVAPFEDVMIF